MKYLQKKYRLICQRQNRDGFAQTREGTRLKKSWLTVCWAHLMVASPAGYVASGGRLPPLPFSSEDLSWSALFNPVNLLEKKYPADSHAPQKNVQMFWHFWLRICSSESRVKATYYTPMESAAVRGASRAVSPEIWASGTVQNAPLCGTLCVFVCLPSPPLSTAYPELQSNTQEHNGSVCGWLGCRTCGAHSRASLWLLRC